MEGLWGKSALLGTMIFCWDDGLIGEVESKIGDSWAGDWGD